jgi:hypothetical protein
MTLTTAFVDAAAAAAERSPDPRVIPWPMPGNPGAFRTFADFAEWRDEILDFSLPHGVPQNMRDALDRALKIYLLAWIDFDLVTAGEMAALSAFEHVLRDCYFGKERDRRRARVVDKAAREKRKATKREVKWIERISFADLCNYMIERDGLTDDKVGLVRRSGGTVKALLTGDRDPSLANLRNIRAHGVPFGSGFTSGLLELIRDLIVYAYRDMIAEARALYPGRISG